MDLRIDRNPAFAVTIAACIGVALSFWPVAFIASIAVLACALRQKKRIHAANVAFTYYACAIWLVIPGAKTFFGPNPGLLNGLAIWLCGTALLTIPYALLWTPNHRTIALRSILIVLASVPPPLGIIGVANPLTAAGFLFPERLGSAWRERSPRSLRFVSGPQQRRSSSPRSHLGAISSNPVFRNHLPTGKL